MHPMGIMLDNLFFNKRGEVFPFRSELFNWFKDPKMDGDYGIYGIPLVEIASIFPFIHWENELDCIDYTMESVNHKREAISFSLIQNGIMDASGFGILERADTQPFVYEWEGAFKGNQGCDMRDCKVEINYLHELQNLYWMLTKRELEIPESKFNEQISRLKLPF